MAALVRSDKWDARFLRLAREVSAWSKDTSTKVGAVLVKDRRVVSTGYNGLPRGFDDDDPRWSERPLKYSLYEHAERNAVYNAAMHGVATQGCDLFVYGMYVCSQCARAAVQSGIVRVVFALDLDRLNPNTVNAWQEDFAVSVTLLEAASVELCSAVVDE